MLQQKIEIKVSMPCDKSRAKVMALVSRATGVISMTITGDLKDRLEVVGEGVDAVCLVSCLRKKKMLRPVEILRVEEVKDKKKEEEKKAAVKQPCGPSYPYCYCGGGGYPISRPMVFCEQDPPATNCSVM